MRPEIKLTLGIATGFVLMHFLYGTFRGMTLQASLESFQWKQFLILVFVIGAISFYLEKVKAKRKRQ